MKLFSKISIMVFLLFICLFISGVDTLHAGWPFICGDATYDDVFKDICILDGYVYSGGYTVNGTDTSFYLVKLDLNGNFEWDSIYGESLEDEVFTCMIPCLNSEGIILAGNRTSCKIPFIFKIDEDGEISDSFYHDFEPDEPIVVGNDESAGSENDLYVFSGSKKSTRGNINIFLMGLNLDLTLKFNYTYYSLYDQIANDIKIIGFNQYIIVGSSDQGFGNCQYIAGIKSNKKEEENLEIIWQITLSPGELFAIEEDPNTPGIYYAVGYDNDVSPTRIKLICFTNESVIWTSYSSGAGPDVDEIGYDIAFSGGDIYVVGTTVNAAGIEGTIISKFLTDGTYDSSVRTYRSYNQGWYGITSIPSNDFIVAGYSEVNDNQKDALADKTYPFMGPESIGGNTGGTMSSYSASNGINDNIDENNIILHQAFSCIFSKEAHISFSLPFDRYVELKIYDITGSEIKTLVNSYMSSGEYSFIWNRDDNTGLEVSYGIYFCKLIVDGEVFTRKITLSQ